MIVVKRLFAGFVIYLFAIAPIVVVGQDAGVDAKQFFVSSSNDNRKYIYIQLPKGQNLVFREEDNDFYYLHGRALTIRVDRMTVKGKVVIRSFALMERPGHPEDKKDRGEDKTTQAAAGPVGGGGLNNQKDGHGDPGKQPGPGTTGDPGGQGPNAQPINLFVGQLVGSGDWSLVVDNGGGKGGRGQQGGSGGKGGKGGNGRDRECSPQNSPGNAGIGGPGGLGGKGGPGGPGGSGGPVQYPRSWCALVALKKVTLLASGGPPGDPGVGGFGGPGGDPGTAGSGKTCGVGIGGESSGGNGNVAGPDHTSLQAALGDPGKPGAEGKTACRDCVGQTCAAAPPTKGPAARPPATGAKKQPPAAP